MKARGQWAGIALLFLAARLPLHLATWALPVSNDDAIPLLMARHVLRGELSTILWNQPYNGTLDTYLLAPGLAVAEHHTVFRLYEAVCGLLLVVAAAAAADRMHGRMAAWAAAALAAVGTPYMALMAATGPTPNFLIPLLVSVPVLAGLRDLQEPARRRSTLRAGGLGLVCGLAIWDSALAIPALAGAAAGLIAAGWRPRVRGIAAFAAGLVLGAAPLVIARVVHASASSPVTALRPRWLWMAGLRDLARASSGLFGLQVPLVVDGPERASLPVATVLALGAGLALLVVAAVMRDRGAWPLLGWAAALAAGFALSRRTGGDEIRYLYGLTVPVFALLGVGAARLGARVPALAALGAVAVSVPWLLGHRVLARTWRNPEHASVVWQVPSLEPVQASLRHTGVRSGYASLQFAARLSVESDETVLASQAWNERIPGDPLRLRDEVDLDPRAAWILSSRLSRGMPRARGFRDLLSSLGGGAWHEDVAAEFSIFRAFRPPYDETRPVPPSEMEVRSLDGTVLPAAVRDRDPRTSWTSPQGIGRGSGLVVRVPPRRLSALVLRVPLDPTPLAARWVCEADGTVVASGPLSHTLQWVNGAPRAGRQALLAVVLPGTSASEVRLIFQDAGPPLGVIEVFLYGPDEVARPADGAGAAEAAYAAARGGSWDDAVRLYADAVRAEPDRASYHACLARAEWRAARRRHLDVESLDDGGPPLVERR
jgi:hypothetical protein